MMKGIGMRLIITIVFFSLSLSTLGILKTKVLVQSDDVIWGFAYLSDDEIIFSEREGSLFYYNIKMGKKKRLTPPKVIAKGQGGLLDVKIKKIGRETYLYITFSERKGDTITTSLARAKWISASRNHHPFVTLFQAVVVGNGGRHFGSRLVFADESLYMTIGDRGERKYAQDRTKHNGSILRLTFKGRPYRQNPFLKEKEYLPEIWSYGHRNPQGIDIHPQTGKVYSVEFGPRGGDELNLVEKGKNYGWPVITYGREYWGPKIGTTHRKGMEQPLIHWSPVISPSGMVFYRGNKLRSWKNQIFVAGLSSQQLRRLKLAKGKVVEQEPLLTELGERIRHVENTPDGFLAVSTDAGQIVKILNK